MNDKIANAQTHIEETVIAQMILAFYREFRGVYGNDTLESSLCAVGPLQSMIGNAIDKGIIKLTTAASV